jgi:hypothetical protein
MTEFLLVYAKLILDKKEEVQLINVYLWGVYHSQEEADKAAAECINQIKGGAIVPRVFLHKPESHLCDTFYEAMEWYDKMCKKMSETNKILQKASQKTKL